MVPSTLLERGDRLPHYYSHLLPVPFDVEVSTAGIAYCRKIAATPQFAAIVALGLPGRGVDLQNYTTALGLGPSSTPLGQPQCSREDGGVVDCELKVYGTSNVCVVDASIIPVHISAHTQGTVYGIAEKAADIILGKH